MHQHNQKRKTLPQDYRHHLCVPSASNRRQSRATRRWFWLQHQQDEEYSSRWSRWPSSERGERTSNHVSQHPLADWRWIRSSRVRPSYQTHWKLSAVNTGERNEDQKLGSQLVFDGTHCPDIRRRLPQGRLNHHWLTPPTRQAPRHPLPDPILKFLDEDRWCSDPVLPHKLPWKCLHSKCEETPEPCRLPPQIQGRSSLVICPVDTARQNSRLHPNLDDGLKQSTNGMHTGHVEYTEQPTTTNQDLVAWPRDIHVHTNGRQSELRIETVDELITSTQTQHFNEGGNLSHHPNIRVHCTNFVNNDVLWEWVLPVSHDQRSPQYLLPLTHYLCWTHVVPLIVKHFPAWRLQPETLVTRKCLLPWKCRKTSWWPWVSNDTSLWQTLQKKRLGFVATSVGPVTKNRPTSIAPQALFILYVFFEHNRRRGSPISLSSPLVSLVSPNRGRAPDGLCSTCSNPLKISSKPVNSKSACQNLARQGKSWVWAGNYAELQTIQRKENIMCWEKTY